MMIERRWWPRLPLLLLAVAAALIIPAAEAAPHAVVPTTTSTQLFVPTTTNGGNNNAQMKIQTAAVVSLRSESATTDPTASIAGARTTSNAGSTSTASSLRGKNRGRRNRWLEVVEESIAQHKQRKDDLFEAREKHPSNDIFDAYDNNKEEEELVDETESNAREDSLFAFDADRYRDVVEKAKEKTLKGTADKKDDEKEKTLKGSKTNDEDKANDQEENSPRESAENVNGREEGTATAPTGSWHEDTLDAVAGDIQGPKGEEPHEQASDAGPAITEAEADAESEAESETKAQSQANLETIPIDAAGPSTNESEAADETTEAAIDGKDGTKDEANTKAAGAQPNLETILVDAAASIIKEDTNADSMPNQNQAGIRGMTPGGKVGISFAFISLFALILIAAAIRRRRQGRRFQNMNDLSSYWDLEDDQSSDDDDGDTAHAVPLYITTPTSAKYAKTDSESNDSDDDNYEDDDVSALPTYIAKYSLAATPSPETTKDKGGTDTANATATKDNAGVRELDGIVAGICFEAASPAPTTNQEDSIWDHSSAPTLDTTDSVLENLPASAQAPNTAGGSSWEQFPSCAVWS
jgi:hypothetical protein